MTVREELKHFFISCFYSILNAEERALESISNGKLSSKEVHVIGAVFKSLETEENNFSEVARILGITLGTLTAAFSRLEKKGYLYKKQDAKDKRIFHIYPTRLAELVHIEHMNFHENMIEDIMKDMKEDDLSTVVKALKTIEKFFDKYPTATDNTNL
jgi:DNA-binding MarR family transcriptional regulator